MSATACSDRGDANDEQQYAFLTRWRVEGTCGEVADILGDPLELPRWWPSVYLRVEETRPPDASGLDRRVRLHTKGWLPYTLTWESELVESRYPYGFALAATGDFDGRGVWTFAQDGAYVDITYDWRLSAEKPLLRNLLLPAEAAVRSEPSVGDGAGRREPEAGAGAPPRHLRRRARRAFRRRRVPSLTPAPRSSAARWPSAPRSRI